MPARVLVYCKAPVKVTKGQVLRALDDADLMTLAEVHDLPEGEEAAVDEMRKLLRIETQGRTLHGAELHWHAKQRPIQVRVGPPLPGELDETLENLPASRRPGAKRVREHLAATQVIFELEMGIDGSHHLAATISEVIAFLVAEQADGIVWFFHREFAAPDDRGATLWQTED